MDLSSSSWSHVTDYERSFFTEESCHAMQEYLRDTQHIPFITCAVYLVAIFGIKAFMKDREAFSLKGPLRYWNLLLAVYSFVSFTRCFPALFELVLVKGFKASVCLDGCSEEGFSRGHLGLWGFVFLFSKFPELVDTLFIVLRKKPLIFLHWYHHVTVLVFCWYSMALNNHNSAWFGTVNMLVHAIMYFYYFLATFGLRPWWGRYVTQLQIAQMVLGMCVISGTIYYTFVESDTCGADRTTAGWGGVMYGSYLALFVNFYIKKMLGGGKKSAKSAAGPTTRSKTGKSKKAE